MRAYAVIDIGGTAIKYGCATEEGQFLEKASRPTRAGAVSIPDVVLAIVKDMAARHELAGIAIDTAGIVRPGEDGEIVFAGETTFPGYSGTKLGRIVRETMQLPVLVENDVNAAALGEVWRGAARGASSAFMITVGTNLGGCFVQQGRIWHGASFSAGEIGYLRLHNEKRILEDVASTRAMIREAAFSHNMSPSELTGETVFDWAREGDEEALAAIQGLADNLGEGLAAVCCLLNPEVIVLGGGVMAQSEVLGPLLERRLEQLVMPAMRVKTRLAFAVLGNDAGMLGALYALLQQEHVEVKIGNDREQEKPSATACGWLFCCLVDQWNRIMTRPPTAGMPTMKTRSRGSGARCVIFAPNQAPIMRPASVWMKIGKSSRPLKR